MRTILTIFVAGVFPLTAQCATLEECSPAFSSNMAIVWDAPTNHLPRSFWTYKRLPQVCSAAAISNGIVLASFEKKGFPRPSRHDVILWADRLKGEPRPPNFAILPNHGQMSFDLGDRAPDSPKDIARDGAAVQRALKCAALLGVDPADLAPTNSVTAGLYGVFLARQVDGVPFANDAEGLQIQFSTNGQVRQFALMWPRLRRQQSCATATSGEIIRCLRARKVVLWPDDQERDYLGRVRRLAQARKLTILKITPLYGEGRFGEQPPDNEPSKDVAPFALLDAVADFGPTTESAKLCSPVLSVDVKRLLENSGKKAAAAKR